MKHSIQLVLYILQYLGSKQWVHPLYIFDRHALYTPYNISLRLKLKTLQTLPKYAHFVQFLIMQLFVIKQRLLSIKKFPPELICNLR